MASNTLVEPCLRPLNWASQSSFSFFPCLQCEDCLFMCSFQIFNKTNSWYAIAWNSWGYPKLFKFFSFFLVTTFKSFKLYGPFVCTRVVCHRRGCAWHFNYMVLLSACYRLFVKYLESYDWFIFLNTSQLQQFLKLLHHKYSGFCGLTKNLYPIQYQYFGDPR
jgi:hypothetical protein